jgi:Leucine-rich repeat (LRR) protein
MKYLFLFLTILLFGCNRHILNIKQLSKKDTYSSIEQALCHINKVYKLEIDHKDSTYLSKDIVKLKRLNELSFYRTNLPIVPGYLSELENLQVLIIQESHTRVIPPEIGKLSNLVELRIWANEVKELPKEIGDLENLRRLGLFANDIKQLPQEISKLTNLNEIGLDSNFNLDFYDAFEKISHLPNLNHLNINYYPHDTLPSNIYKLKNIESVSIWNFSTGKLNIDDAIKKLSSLKKLKTVDLSGNHVGIIPREKYIEEIKKKCNNCEVIWGSY